MEEADIFVSCPYNPAHRIRKYKLMSHMAKCKKTSKVVNKVECPLDKSHIIDRDHLKEHIASCSSLGKLISMDSGYDKPNVDVEYPIINAYNSTENWEEEPEVPSYDPMEVSSKKPVIRCVSGLTKSERKKFKESERMRIASLKGLYPESEASSSTKDTVCEIPLRPPRDAAVSPIRILQDGFDKSTQMAPRDHDVHDADVQAKFVRNNSFHRMLYDELAPEDDKIQHLKQSVHSIDTKISLIDYFQHVNRENGSFSISDQKQESKVKKTNTISKLFHIDNEKIEKDECIASTSSTSGERVTDKLLALLRNESSVKKVQPMEEAVKIGQMNKDPDEKKPTLDEILSKFNERLMYLTDIQNAAAKESAQILELLKTLKLSEEMVLRK